MPVDANLLKCEVHTYDALCRPLEMCRAHHRICGLSLKGLWKVKPTHTCHYIFVVQDDRRIYPKKKNLPAISTKKQMGLQMEFLLPYLLFRDAGNEALLFYWVSA
ncbi:hypothetical protein IEQ34_014389 [Dendrobium chrysotoxum]|uniref:Uncharacterized protein n=1 Tax=Dendrobium chrysotoxum TaxID=161865 RepID=A0AAV7GLU6_DENCH|nr:hypothetical protein IEQ34_014389 [Dendrobium chrysotoxum]